MYLDKPEILRKLKEIDMAQQEDRESPEKEMERVIAQEEVSPDNKVDYYDTLYMNRAGEDDQNKENPLLAAMERISSKAPTSNEPGIYYGKTN
jgi:hypothetical protein